MNSFERELLLKVDAKQDTLIENVAKISALFEEHTFQDKEDFGLVNKQLEPVVKHVDRLNWLFKFLTVSGVSSGIFYIVKVSLFK